MFTIGICGGSGSGKSTLVEQLLAQAGRAVAVLPHDAYYHGRDELPSELRDAGNFDHPDALDNRLFLHHVAELRAGRAVEQPVYDFANHRRTAQTRRIDPPAVLLVEGILLFAVPGLLALLDLKVYVDTPDDLRILRRMLRDVRERGRSPQDVVEQYLATVRPMHHQFVEPGRRLADIVVPWEYHNPAAVALLVIRIRAHLAGQGG